jgi:DNA-binding response OmpR family regulator
MCRNIVDGTHQKQHTLATPVRVLVIADDDDLIEVIQTTFDLGWPEVKLIRAETGEQGIVAAEADSPNVIILDLARPNINGFETLRQIREFSGIPIVALIANDDEKDIVKAFTWGANGCLIKPLRQMEFLARIKSLTSGIGRTYSLNGTNPAHPRGADPSAKSHSGVPEAWEKDKHIVGQCPECSSILVYQENCLLCPVCGFHNNSEFYR